MNKSIISEGKTTNEAIEKGLKKLNVSKNMVDIKVLESQEKRSFFDILSPRVVKVEIVVKENIKEEQIRPEKGKIKNIEIKEIDENEFKLAKTKIDEFLQEFLKKISEKEFIYTIDIIENDICIDIKGEHAGILIGYRGDNLNSLQVILNIIANKKTNSRIKVLLDVEGYRSKRVKVLEELAIKVSKTVLKTGKAIKLEPMSAYERKIIHSKLQENNEIETYSIGEEPNRKIVISKK